MLDNEEVLGSLLRQTGFGDDGAGPVDPDAAYTRILRKVQGSPSRERAGDPGDGVPLTPRQQEAPLDLTKLVPDQQPQPQQDEAPLDLTKLGPSAQDAPKPVKTESIPPDQAPQQPIPGSAATLGSKLQPPRPDDGPLDLTKLAPPQQEWSYPGVIGLTAGQTVTKQIGDVVESIGIANSEQQAYRNFYQTYQNWNKLDPITKDPDRGYIWKLLRDNSDLSEQAKQNIADSFKARERGDPVKSFEEFSAGVRPIQQEPTYQMGKRIGQYAESQFPLTDEEKRSRTGRITSTVAGAAVPVLTAIATRGMGLPLSAAVFAGSSAGAEFDKAKAAGADDETAAKAAGWSATVNGALGLIQIGAVLRPVQREAPGLVSWAWAKLNQAKQSSITFAGIGEVQEWLGQEIAKTFYDPKAGYQPDVERILASLIGGGIVGLAHQSPAKPSEPAARAAAPDDGAEPPPQDNPQPKLGVSGEGARADETSDQPGRRGKLEDALRVHGFDDGDLSNMSYTDLRDELRNSDILDRHGYSNADMAAMTPAERKTALDEALKAGAYHPPEEPPDEPSAAREAPAAEPDVQSEPAARDAGAAIQQATRTVGGVVHPDDHALAAQLMQREGSSAEAALARATIRNALAAGPGSPHGGLSHRQAVEIFGRDAIDAIQSATAPESRAAGAPQPREPGTGDEPRELVPDAGEARGAPRQGAAAQAAGLAETQAGPRHDAPLAAAASAVEPAAAQQHPAPSGEAVRPAARDHGDAGGDRGWPAASAGQDPRAAPAGRAGPAAPEAQPHPADRADPAEAARPPVERTTAGERHGIRGADRIGNVDLVQRRADAPLKAKTPQKRADELGLLGDEPQHADLVDRARSTAEPPRYSLRPRTAPGDRRELGLPTETDPPIQSYRNPKTIQAHPDYEAAKAGDGAAAARLVADVVKPETVEEAGRRFGPHAVYVPVHAEEAAGRNRIPMTLARYYAEATGASVERRIVQSTRAYHTGAPAVERLIARPGFHGPVEPGKRYVIVDDVSVMGNTLAELANHIRQNGGEVAGVVTLVNASRMPHNVPEPRRLKMLEERHGNAIREELDIEPGALTAAEAEYLLNFRTSDALRDRVAKARRDRSGRLRAKGVRPSEAEDAVEPARPETENGAPSGAVSDSEGPHGDEDDRASLRLGPESPYTPQAEARLRDIRQFAQAAADNLVGRGVLRVETPDEILLDHGPIGWGSVGEGKERALGMYLPSEALIKLSLRDPATGLPRSGRSIFNTALHEPFHHLYEAFPPHIKAMFEREKPRLARIIGEEFGLSREEAAQLTTEETATLAWELYGSNKAHGNPGYGFHIGIRRVFDHILETLRRLRNALNGMGFHTAEDIFNKAYRGEYARRAGGEANPATAPPPPRASIRERTPQERAELHRLPPGKRREPAIQSEPAARDAGAAIQQMTRAVGGVVHPDDHALAAQLMQREGSSAEAALARATIRNALAAGPGSPHGGLSHRQAVEIFGRDAIDAIQSAPAPESRAAGAPQPREQPREPGTGDEPRELVPDAGEARGAPRQGAAAQAAGLAETQAGPRHDAPLAAAASAVEPAAGEQHPARGGEAVRPAARDHRDAGGDRDRPAAGAGEDPRAAPAGRAGPGAPEAQPHPADRADPAEAARSEVKGEAPRGAVRPRSPEGAAAKLAEEPGDAWGGPSFFKDLGPFEVRPDVPIGRQAQDAVLARGRETGVEHVIAIDKDGSVVINGHGIEDKVAMGEAGEAALSDPSRALVLHHNHPRNSTLSKADIRYLGNPGLQAIWAHGHDGIVARAELTPQARAVLRGMDAEDARSTLLKLAVDAENHLRGVLKSAVNDGLLDLDEGWKALRHSVNVTLSRAGVIDYRSNYEAPARLAALDVNHYIDQAADKIAWRLFNAPTHGAHRGAEPLRHPGDLGATFGRPHENAGEY